MMGGKTIEQKKQTIINLARTNGIDPNEKIFSEEDLKSFGLK